VVDLLSQLIDMRFLRGEMDVSPAKFAVDPVFFDEIRDQINGLQPKSPQLFRCPFAIPFFE
jgi:hypothetical protein